MIRKWVSSVPLAGHKFRGPESGQSGPHPKRRPGPVRTVAPMRIEEITRTATVPNRALQGLLDGSIVGLVDDRVHIGAWG